MLANMLYGECWAVATFSSLDISSLIYARPGTRRIPMSGWLSMLRKFLEFWSRISIFACSGQSRLKKHKQRRPATRPDDAKHQGAPTLRGTKKFTISHASYGYDLQDAVKRSREFSLFISSPYSCHSAGAVFSALARRTLRHSVSFYCYHSRWSFSATSLVISSSLQLEAEKLFFRFALFTSNWCGKIRF